MTVTSVGYGDIVPTCDIEYVTCIAAMVSSRSRQSISDHILWYNKRSFLSFFVCIVSCLRGWCGRTWWGPRAP